MGNNESQNLDNLNIILLGRTGVGKSTLINSIFGDELADEGDGFSCTKKIDPYTLENSHITLYDTPSLEINSIASFKETIYNIINEQAKTKDINKVIHCIWYCIDSNKDQIKNYEKQIISIFKNIPVIIVLTKSFNLEKANKLMCNIESQKMNVKYVAPVLSKKMNNQEPFGIDNLIYFSTISLPPNIKATCSYDHLNFKNQIKAIKPKRRTKPFRKNILVLGKTGIGKSTLVNYILGEKKAKISSGLPTTKIIEGFDSLNLPYHVIDTPGLILKKKQNEMKNDIVKLINDRSNNDNIKEHIHCIWYCVWSEYGKMENEEINFINEIYSEIKNKKISVIIVLTQCINDDNIKIIMKQINETKINCDKISPILCEEMESNFGTDIIGPFGVEELTSFTNHYISKKYNLNESDIHYDNKLEDEIRNLKKINVIIIGESECEKTLISHFIGEKNINPINDINTINEYEDENCCFHFYHSHCFDLNPVKQVKLRENIIKLVNDRYETGNFHNIIHCVWFCVKCDSQNSYDQQLEFIDLLSNKLKLYKIPVILVLTEFSDENIKEQMIEKINNNYKSINYIQPILTEGFIDNSNQSIQNEAFGFNELFGITNRALSENFISDSFDEQIIDDTLNNLPKINIIAIGKAGAGKSTLINNFFRGNLAATGIGAPVTQRITPLTTPNNPLTVYDTPGFELNYDQNKNLRKDIIKLIKDGYKTNDINKYIHCIWYCINSETGRYENFDIDFINELTEVTNRYQVSVFIILTQSYRKKDAMNLKKLIEAENIRVVKVIPVVAQMKKYGQSICKPFGLDELAQEMGDRLPDSLKITFCNVQKASRSYKRKCAAGVIGGFVTSAGVIGGSPIPFSDCFLLAGLEVAMFSSITAIYKVKVSKGFISTVLSCLIGCASASLIGRTIVVNLIKIIPFAGSIVGGITGCITGGILTGAFGGTYMLIMEAILNGEIDPNNISKSELKMMIEPIFNKKLKEEKEKKEKEEKEMKEMKEKEEGEKEEEEKDEKEKVKEE